MKVDKKLIVELLPYLVAISICIYWIATGDKVKNDPYLLGLFRGIVCPLVIYSWIRRLVN